MNLVEELRKAVENVVRRYNASPVDEHESERHLDLAQIKTNGYGACNGLQYVEDISINLTRVVWYDSTHLQPPEESPDDALMEVNAQRLASISLEEEGTDNHDD